MDKKVALCIISLALLFTSMLSISGASNGFVNSVSDPVIVPNQTSGPIIGDPLLNPTNPDPDLATSVSAQISDTVTLDDTRLYYTYEDEGTEYDTAMSPVTDLIVDSNSETWNNTDQDNSPNYASGNYSSNLFSTSLTITVSRNGGGQANLVYLIVEVYNLTTDQWVVSFEEGDPAGTTDIPSASGGSYTYTNNSNLGGFRFFAVNYRSTGGGANQATIDLVQVGQDSLYTANIPAYGSQTMVSYYIVANNTNGDQTTSPTYEFALDNVPIITFNNYQTVTGGGTPYTVNVTVTDGDGWNTVDQSSIIAYYRVQGQQNYSSFTLSFLRNTTINSAIYIGERQFSEFAGQEVTMELVVNATSQINGEASYVGQNSNTFVVDNAGASVNSIVLLGDPLFQNNTLPTSNLTLVVEFVDVSGIASAEIFYRLPGETNFVSMEMNNLTELLPTDTSEIFNITIDPVNTEGEVEYYFVTTDFLLNQGESFLQTFNADGSGPSIYDLIREPEFVTSTQSTNILFNALDISGISMTTLYYKQSWEDTYSSTNVGPVNYNVDFSSNVADDSLPILIPDEDTASTTIEVRRLGSVDEAIVNGAFNHPRPTDLRMWIVLENGSRYMVFDREDATSFSVNLFDFGFNEEMFNAINLTLEVKDLNTGFEGSLTSFDIDLNDLNYPAGYEYQAVIPTVNNDTQIDFFLSISDNLGNVVNTTVYNFYSDALPPNFLYSGDLSEYRGDVNGKNFVDFEIDILDNSGIQSAEVYYRHNGGFWNILEMDQFNESSLHTALIPYLGYNGTLEFYVRAFDFAGFENQTMIYEVEYDRANAPLITPFNIPEGLFNANDEREFEFLFSVTDDGSVRSISFEYKVDDDDWEELEISLSSNGNYSMLVPYGQGDGSMSIRVTASDDRGLTGSETFVFNFENASGINWFLWIGGGLALIAIIAGGYILFTRYRDRLPFTKTPAD